MKIIQTGSETGAETPVFMLLYGPGGVGKSTFASTAPNPIMADCEGGTKFFGKRGIKMNVVRIESWPNFVEFVQVVSGSEKVKTVIVDPIGELLEYCKRNLTSTPKFVQSDGSLTMAGWGELKERLLSQFRLLRDSGKHVIFISHIEEKDDEGRLVKRPKIQTKISEDIVNMVDIVAYAFKQKNQKGEMQYLISVDPLNDKIAAKDRTGMLPTVVEPNFEHFLKAVNPETEKEGAK